MRQKKEQSLEEIAPTEPESSYENATQQSTEEYFFADSP